MPGSGTITNHQEADKKAGKNYNYAEIGENKSGGTNSPAFSANHIIQYPRQPKRDDGKWLAIASLLGAVLGRFASNSLIKKAKDAEDTWRSINDRMRDTGYKLLDTDAPAEKALADAADDWLLREADWLKDRALDEEAYADKLEPCNDTIHERLCEFILCGYKPDYLGISMRVVADAEAKAKQKRQELCRQVNRYGANQCCEIETRTALATAAEIVGTVAKAREAERQTAWQTNMKLHFDGADIFEKHRESRKNRSSDYEKTAINVQDKRFSVHQEKHLALYKLGLDVLASAGKNYAWLAASLRQTAEKDVGGISALAGLLAMAVGYFLCYDSEDNCSGGGGGGSDSGPGAPTTNSETAF
nr:MAG TPA: hypothetical protein [Caudoviricetes sp.]